MPLTPEQMLQIEQVTIELAGHMNAINAAIQYTQALVMIDQRPENADGSILPEPLQAIAAAKQHALEAAQALVAILS